MRSTSIRRRIFEIDRELRRSSAKTGAIPVADLNDLIHHFAAFQASSLVPPVGLGWAILSGNGGGRSVIATDQFGRCGINIAPLNNRLVRRLNNLEVPDGVNIANVIDVSATY